MLVCYSPAAAKALHALQQLVLFIHDLVRQLLPTFYPFFQAHPSIASSSAPHLYLFESYTKLFVIH